MIDEGYIKFDCNWIDAAAISSAEIASLIDWRNRLFQAGLIGHDDEHDVGFGNISCRVAGAREFVISATQTGHVTAATAEHFTRVVDYDIDANRVACRGPRMASSESLTHAAIYELDAAFLAVVHVHSRELWEALARRVPTTGVDVAYGTPAMAQEFGRLYRQTDLSQRRLVVMAGHEAGLVSVGSSVPEAAKRLIEADQDQHTESQR